MHISKVHLKGFRNFKDAIIHFAYKSLVIGSNDIGKSNLLYALRILLDKSLSESELEPQDSDFYAHDDTNEIEITIYFEDVSEECVISKLREHISDSAHCVLRYQAIRDPKTKSIKHPVFFAGKDDSSLIEIQSRFYLRSLNLKFIGTKRDLASFIKRERKNLLDDARAARTEEKIEQDTTTLNEIKSDLGTIDNKVKKLSYIDTATHGLNKELKALSHHHTALDIIFDTGASDPAQYVDNLQLASRVNGKNLAIGGDGRNNQIHLALWSARNNTANSDDEPLEVCIFCIEEPETHLHPHQQRKLSNYLSETLKAQVIITTHSPQITCEFSPKSLIRLYDNHPDTLAAGNGINPFTETKLIEFGFRLNIIPAEAFFSNMVFLVEGVSDEMFYKELARRIDIDLDMLNISILMVDGIGFKPYASLLNSLNIPYVIRTDNDIFKVQNKQEYRFAGVQRALSACRDRIEADDTHKSCLTEEPLLKGFSTKIPPAENQAAANKFIKVLKNFDVYVAGKDLENDLHTSLGNATRSYFGLDNDDEVIKAMQKRKGESMFAFLQACSSSLSSLANTALAEPLLKCKQKVEAEV